MNPFSNSQNLVSIILPTYNQAEYLPEALDGVFNQTYENFELIVINDGSTDGTRDVLERYTQMDPRIQVIHQANQKLPQSLNNGFCKAKGDYLTWTSSDNCMGRHMIERLVRYLNAHPTIGMVYSDWEWIDENGRSMGLANTFDYDPFLLMRINFINASFLYRKEVQEVVGLYNPDYLYAEDWEYWLRISRSFKIAFLPEVLYRYRVHSKSLTSTEVIPRKKQGGKDDRLVVELKRNKINWIISKIKFELLRLKLREDPKRFLQPKIQSTID